MAARVLPAFALALTLTTACGGSSPAPPTVPAGGGPETINGSERLGWDQLADGAAELATIGWALYVDGTRFILTDVACSAVAPSGRFPCTGRLPALTAGTHTLQIASFFTGDPESESSRSSSLQVTVRAAAASMQARAPAAAATPGGTPAADAGGVRVDRLSDGLSEPTDAAFAPDGRLFVAERRGVVSVLGGAPMRTIARSQLDDVVTDGTNGLLGIALDPDFERTRFVFVVYTAAGRNGRAGFQLTRFREVQGLLGERAVLLDAGPASPERASAAIRFGPDRLLYVALDDGGDPRAPADPSSLNGKLLRLSRDGTIPPDQATPVLWSGLRSPRGLAFARSSIWLSDVGDARTGRLTALALQSGRPRQAAVVETHELAGPDVGPLATVDQVNQVPRRDALWMASAEGEFIMRVPRRPGTSVERHRVGPIRVVFAGPEGAIYFCTNTILGRLAVPDR